MINKEIVDKNIWEKFVTDERYNTSFFQSWDWGEFEKSLGRNVQRLGFFENDGLRAVAQLVEIKAKRGKFLHIRNGPVMDWGNTKQVKQITSILRNLAKSKSCDFIRLSPQIKYSKENEELLKRFGYLKNQMHDVDAEITWVLDLSESLENILQNMRKNTRYYIRKADKEGVEVKVSSDIKDLKLFFDVYEDTVKRQKWNAYSYDYLESEFRSFAKNNQIEIYLAYYEGRVIASSLFIYYRNEVIYHHSGSLTEFRHIPASYLIQWKAIENAKSRGFKKYNFFGIARDDNPNHPWAGLSFFKKGFGGYEQRWVHSHDLPLTLKYYVTYLYEYFERKKRGY